MEIQQSSRYADYIRSLGWVVEKLDDSFVFIKPFPVIGGLAKIQRVVKLPLIGSLIPIFHKYHVRTLAIEPDSRVPQHVFAKWCRTASSHVRLNHDSFIPTKTIRVDLKSSETDLFRSFIEAKRRAVRRAEKHGVIISQSNDIDSFIQLKNQSAGFLGCITTTGVNKLWKTLPQRNKILLFAHSPTKRAVGGIFLLLWDHIAYYWIAAATKEGKKLFAPTLLVWEALKVARLRKCTSLDFVGVWDERLPNKNHEWKGFTKFKEGFGGTALYYPLAPQNS